MDNTRNELLLAVIVGKSCMDFVFNDSDEEETDTDEETDVYINKFKKRVCTDKRPQNRIQGYVKNIVPNYDGKQFQMHFRLTREAFDHLLNILIPGLINQSEFGGRPTIDPTKQLLAAIWLLATPESYRSVGDRFDLGKSSLFHCFRRVVLGLNQNAKNYIRWPNVNRRIIVKEKFRQMSGIPNILGIIDGTYVKIKAPRKNPQNYVNRKCFHGITLQGICDHNLKFTDCYAGYPSSVSDARIFRNSGIFQEFTTNTDVYFPQNEFILGDKAYPTTTWCIPPYIERRRLTNVQRYFNRKHAQTRQCIERSFALLFGRFRRLRDLDMNLDDFIPATILACCVLHNICLYFRDDNIENYIMEGREFLEKQNQNFTEEEGNAPVQEHRDNAINKRDTLAQNLYVRRRM